MTLNNPHLPHHRYSVRPQPMVQHIETQIEGQNRERLEDRVERLALTCEALWLLLKSCTDLTDQELLDMVQRLDLSDGFYDQRKREMPRSCACGAKVQSSDKNCSYCGRTVPGASPFA